MIIVISCRIGKIYEASQQNRGVMQKQQFSFRFCAHILRHSIGSVKRKNIFWWKTDVYFVFMKYLCDLDASAHYYDAISTQQKKMYNKTRRNNIFSFFWIHFRSKLIFTIVMREREQMDSEKSTMRKRKLMKETDNLRRKQIMKSEQKKFNRKLQKLRRNPKFSDCSYFVHSSRFFYDFFFAFSLSLFPHFRVNPTQLLLIQHLIFHSEFKPTDCSSMQREKVQRRNAIDRTGNKKLLDFKEIRVVSSVCFPFRIFGRFCRFYSSANIIICFFISHNEWNNSEKNDFAIEKCCKLPA